MIYDSGIVLITFHHALISKGMMHNRLRVLKNFGCYEIITVIKLTEEFDEINGKILVKLKQDKGCSCLTGSIHKN